jgi:hypothetical protein
VIKKFYKHSKLHDGDGHEDHESIDPVAAYLLYPPVLEPEPQLINEASVRVDSKRSEVMSDRTDVNAFTTSNLVIGQNYKDVLAVAFSKYQEDTANGSNMSCPLGKENACENPGLEIAAPSDAMANRESQHMLETCIVFLG